MAQVLSKDGTKIGYDVSGAGPLLIIVNGSVGYRDYHGDRELAQALSKHFRTIRYDRRGRGESSDTLPYSVMREVEDIDALISVVESDAYIYGVSTGAILALKATATLKGKVTKLAMFEPPCTTGDAAKSEFLSVKKQLSDYLSKGKVTEAVELYMTNFMSPEDVSQFRQNFPEDWEIMVAVAHTLEYDYAILGDGTPPVADIEKVEAPTLLITASNGLPYIEDAIGTMHELLKNARRETLAEQQHEPSPEAICNVLIPFFKNESPSD